MVASILIGLPARIGQAWEPLREARGRCCEESVDRYDPESKDLWSLDARPSPPRSSAPLFSLLHRPFLSDEPSRGLAVLWVLFNCFIAAFRLPLDPFSLFPPTVSSPKWLSSLGHLANGRLADIPYRKFRETLIILWIIYRTYPCILNCY